MKYISPRSQIRKRSIRYIAISCLCVLILIFVDIIAGGSMISRGLQYFDSKTLDKVAFNGMRAKTIYTFLKDGKSVYNTIKENEKLKESIVSLKTQIQEDEIRITSLEKSASITSIKGVKTASGYITEILNYPEGTYYRINIGSKQLIKKGNAVITDTGVMIGKIAEVFPEYSIVRSLDSTISKVSVTVLNAGRSLGLLVGDLEFGVNVEKLPATEKTNNGESVITSGQEERIPAGIPVGTVRDAVYKEGDLFQMLLVDTHERFVHYFDVVKVYIQ